jgi:hypothetical protein
VAFYSEIDNFLYRHVDAVEFHISLPILQDGLRQPLRATEVNSKQAHPRSRLAFIVELSRCAAK